MTSLRTLLRSARALGLLTVFAVNGGPAAAQPYQVDVQPNIVYDTVNGRSLKLDVYKPHGDSGTRRPFVLAIHGGCFTGGSKSEGGSTGIVAVARDLASEGFVVASVDYRLAPTDRYPAALQDVRMALRWARQNASSLNIDLNRTAALGQSAGGALAAMLGVKPVTDRQQQTDAHSDRVKVVVDFYGRTDFMHDQHPNEPAVEDCAEKYIGQPRAAAPDQYRQASPLTHVDTASARFVIVHGTGDHDVLPLHSLRLHQKLLEARRPSTLLLIEGGVHASTARSIRFAKAQLKQAFGMPHTWTESRTDVLRIDAGNPSLYPTPAGYVADQRWQGGQPYTYTPSEYPAAVPLLRTVRFSETRFAYRLDPSSAGVRKVVLHFMDPRAKGTGERLTDIDVMGLPLFVKHDPMRFVARAVPLSHSFYIDGTGAPFTLDFVRRASLNAAVAGLEMIGLEEFK